MTKRKSKDEVLIILETIIEFCEEEKQTGHYAFPVEQVIKRVAIMTGKSERTIKRIKSQLLKSVEAQPSTSITVTSEPVKRKGSSKIILDDADKCVLRNKISSMYTVTKTVPTLSVLHAFMTTDTEFTGCKETLRKILIDMGYKYKKSQSNRKYLMERDDIVAWRARYLRFMKYNHSLGDKKRPIVYLDESYVHKNYTVSRCWQSSEEKGVLKKDGAGQRWIIGHAGGEMGFIKNALLLFKSKTKSGNYHDEINYDNFSKWFKTQLIPNLPSKSIIVTDNASYHSVQLYKAPTSSSKKAEIISWLISKNIHHHPEMLKCELLEIVRRNKTQPEYEIDNYAAALGHTVVRLPPYHCDLNPIELISSMVKRKVASRNVDGSCDVEALIRRAFAEVTPDLWQAKCRHVKKVEQEYFERDKLTDQSQQFIINLNESDSETDWLESDDTS